jgi:hypothetical protein
MTFHRVEKEGFTDVLAVTDFVLKVNGPRSPGSEACPLSKRKIKKEFSRGTRLLMKIRKQQ